MPPPAIQLTKVLPLWSRPLVLWLYGVRPNSVVQNTTVSSSRPRALRSRSSPAIGWSERTHIFSKSEPGVMSPWLSQLPEAPVEPGAAPELDEPHAALDQPPRDEAIAARAARSSHRRSRRAFWWRRSRRAGRAPPARRAACAPPARSSRCALRAANRRRRSCARLSFAEQVESLAFARRDSRSRRSSARTRSGTGFSAAGLSIVPWCDAGRKPFVHAALPVHGSPTGSGSATNTGRLSLRLPSA